MRSISSRVSALRDAPQIGDQPVSFVVAQTSVWVPVLLAAFYAVDGGLYLLLCRRRDEAVTKVRTPNHGDHHRSPAGQPN